MRLLYILLIVIFTANCLTRFPGDRYQKTSNYYSNENFKKSSIYKLRIGNTTKKEVIEEFGKIYDNHLTFAPVLKRRYNEKIYEIGYLVHYGYADSVVEKGPGFESHEIRENIQLTMFFDKNEILQFYYVNHEGGKEELHNLPPNEDKAKLWPDIACDFKYYESVSNPIIGWRLGNMAEIHDKSLKCEWEKYIGEDRVK